METGFRGWVGRHRNVALSFMIGMTLGILIVAFAYFSSRSQFGGTVYGYGVRLSGHTDIDEDLLWFLCGVVVGAGVLSWAWWRDGKAQADGLEDADVLNRFLGEPPGKQAVRTPQTEKGPRNEP